MKKLNILIILLLVACSASAQHFGIGLSASHLFDLYEGPTKLTFEGEEVMDFDMHSDHSFLDPGISYGLDFFYHMKKTSLDLVAQYGSMSGARDVQMYESSVALLSFGVNFRLTGNVEKKSFPYLRLSVGGGYFDAERSFIDEGVVFSETSGFALQNGLGFGVNFGFGENWRLRLSAEGIVNYTDAWDGYDNGKGTDFMTRSGISFSYTFNNQLAKFQRISVPGS